ncbi:hypothetical protein [Thaumasiovibrio subtropicus]|uniref:hypothetical protein n=1 Tax=Thaumasiovibrio subtropicus TaxID=1891207 RepID=UPI000B350675|nr:hypothetical protein [Thaumasiovibrio subtropicus]
MQQKRVLVITGTSDLGHTYCLSLADENCIPIALSEDVEQGHKLVDDEPRARFVEMTLRSEDDFNAILASLPQYLKPIDHVIYLLPTSAYLDRFTTLADWQPVTQHLLSFPATFIESLTQHQVSSCTFVSAQVEKAPLIQKSIQAAFKEYAQHSAALYHTQCRINCIEYDAQRTHPADVIRMSLQVMQGTDSMWGKVFTL